MSDAPGADEFGYTFDALSELTAGLLDQLGVRRYAIYVQDYTQGGVADQQVPTATTGPTPMPREEADLGQGRASPGVCPGSPDGM
ncbi:hypothetical protein [Paractinoplanes brasiliensis]|uniref:hypothetical protein n=1 Tax=Paractinoplanes brasiliensis TaxID=52695 RepID=UPI001A606AD9|nr:hypothetical protein [Actinoplanes brasiliensis]GID27672.1 hypothetical protein Abr02nite_26550 [Actinoplanes brasiliensis]